MRNRHESETRRNLAAELAEAIRLGAYRPGDWLRQIDLEERFGATRFEVRGALDALAVRKTLEHVRNRGYRVAAIDEATAGAIRAARVVLETACAPGIVAGADPALIARLETAAGRFGKAVLTGTRIEQSRANSEFHHLMYARCGNPVLEELIWALRDRSRGSGVTVWTSHEALLASDRDHQAMIVAIAAGDAARLEDLIARHILKGPAPARGRRLNR